MKKQLFLLMCALCSVFALNAQTYGVRVNGTTDYKAEKVGETDYQGREQFLAANVPLNQGDKFKIINLSTGDQWVISNIDKYGEYENFEIADGSYVCKKTGCYDFYIKTKYNDDMLYIGAGANCSETPGQGGQGEDCVPEEHKGEYRLVLNGSAYITTYKDCDKNEYFCKDLKLEKDDNLMVGNTYYKLENGGASANFEYVDKAGVVCKVAGTYNVYIKPESQMMYIALADDTPIVEPEKVYSVVGELPIVKGTVAWNAEETLNDMTLVEGVYTLELKDVKLAAKSYEYKFISDHRWNNNYQLPAEGNYKLTADKAGTYDILYTLNPEKNEGGAKLTLIKADSVADTTIVEPEKVYSVVGELPIVNGTVAWNAEEKLNDMTLVEGVYTLELKDVKLAAKSYEYKFISDHRWNNNYQLPAGGNYKLTADKAGTYDILYTLNPEKNEGGAKLTLIKADSVADTTIVEPEKVYSVVGELPIVKGTVAWNAEETLNDMTLVEGVYTLELKDVKLAAKSYEYKFISDHRWENNYQLPSDHSNKKLDVDKAGTYDILYTLNPEKNEGGAKLTLIKADSVADTTIVEPIKTRELALVPRVWSEAGAKFAIWSWSNDADGAWSEFMAGKDTVRALIPETATKVIFARINSEAAAPDWKAVWNQTDDLELNERTNVYTITGWGAEGGKSEGSWDVVTSLIDAENNAVLRVENNTISVNTDEQTSVVIYNVAGQMIDNAVVRGNFTRTLNSGLYIIKIGGQSVKAIVR